TFEAPAWVMKVFVILVMAGFPIALVLAWAFEMTPEGIKRTEDVDGSKSVVGKTGRKLDLFIIAVLLAVIGILIFQRVHHKESPDLISLPEKSIAVLPLENLSDEKENAFFADGIQDELLTSLSKIRDLKVISRTSVMQYKSGITRNLREIAQQLGVANVLEGSVRRANNHVRVSVQLIDAKSDRHVWAENYDRTLADSISLQSELAGEIANALRASLSPEEKARVETKPTANAEAYLLYLQARGPQTRPSALLQDKQLAEQLYKQAITLDPKFALAHAQLSQTVAEIYHTFQPTKVREIEARTEAKEALRLQPDLGEGHVARALCFYWIDVDYERALNEFDLAARLLPNKADTAPLKNALAVIPADVDPDGLVTLTRWDVALVERDFAAAERAVAACKIETIPAASGPPLPKSYLKGCIELARGRTSNAQPFFEMACPSLE